MVLTFKSEDETLVCDHSSKRYWAVRLCGTVHYAVEQWKVFEFSTIQMNVSVIVHFSNIFFVL